MKHLTEPLSAKEIRDALGVTDEDLEAARRAIGGTMSGFTRFGYVEVPVEEWQELQDAKEDIASLQAENENNIRKILPFAEHKSGCLLEGVDDIDIWDECTCGLNDIVYELGMGDDWRNALLSKGGE